MFKCNNCGCKFENPRKVDLETYYGVYSCFGNSYGEMINLCPNCEDNDIIEYDEEKEETINNIKHRANEMLRMCHVLEWKKELDK